MNVIDGILKSLNDIKKRLDRLETRNYSKFVPLTAPLTSASWDGDPYSSVAISTQLDLSSVFSAPAGIKAVLLKVYVNDDAAWGTGGLYFGCGPSSADWNALVVPAFGGDVISRVLSVCPCDSNGDVWYRINASGAGTMDIILQIWGYWI